MAWPAADRIARGSFTEPAIAVDATGAVHIAVTGTGSDNQGIWYLTIATGGWVKQQVVMPWISQDYDRPGRVDQPAIAIDASDGSVWIAFSYWSCADCYPNYADAIFLVNNAAGTWSEPVHLTDGCEVHSSLAVHDGHVYLACARDGDYVHPHGAILFGTDASGAWVMQQVVQSGALPHLVLDAEGLVAILFAASDLRYARQKPNGSFAIEHLPGTADGRGSWYSVLAVDAVTGDTWAAWTAATDDQGHYSILLATRGPDGWSDPNMAIADGELMGLGVYDGAVQLTVDKLAVTYATNAGGMFVEQVIDPSDAYWQTSAFALGPSGQPYVVFTHDIDTGGAMGIWFLKGPAS